MRTALEHYGEIDAEDWLTIQAIRGWLDGLPNKGNANDAGDHLWSCHALCRAASTIFALGDRGWRVVDGYFARAAYDHAWLVRETEATSSSDFRRTILDVYPFASAGGPIMVGASSWNTPWQQLYVVDTFRPERYKRCFDSFETDAAVLVAITTAKEGNVRL